MGSYYFVLRHYGLHTVRPTKRHNAHRGIKSGSFRRVVKVIIHSLITENRDRGIVWQFNSVSTFSRNL